MPKNIIQSIRREYLKFHLKLNPQQSLFFGFFTYMMLGWILLSLPFSQKISTGFLDTLFTSTSALSTTGLVTVSTFDNYTFFGQLIILTLIQIGGIGYMTLTTYYLLSTTKSLTHWHEKLMKTEFTMPREFKINDFLKSVIVFTLVMETIGAILFFIAFKMENVDTGFAIWSSIFHSVSAFCTAGFGLYNNSFEGFATHDFINCIIIILSISGALGFIVVTDIWNYFRKRTKAISFTSKMISGGFFTLLFIATAIIFIYEPLLKNYSFGERLQLAFFQAMTSITTVGFNTVVVGNLSLPILLVTFFLMYVGASPSSTAGGMKITTLTALISIIKSKLQNNSKVTFMHRVIPKERLDIAISTFIFYTSILFLSTFLLTFSENFTFEKILFETLSAMGTVGLSMGITGNLSDFGKIVIICIMFIGRLGVLTFGLALLAKKQQKNYKNEEDLAV